jgi:hypothetical protein
MDYRYGSHTVYNIEGGVSNVDIDGNNALQIKAIGVVISTFETLPPCGRGALGSAHALGQGLA